MWMIKRLFVLSLLLVAAYRIDELEQQVAELKAKPAIVYQVDNAGSEMVGTVTDKEVIKGRYTLTIGAYGKFLVTEQQYYETSIGDPIPEFLKGRGN